MDLPWLALAHPNGRVSAKGRQAAQFELAESEIWKRNWSGTVARGYREDASRSRRAHRAHAQALEIEAKTNERLADEYDAAQERGEVASQSHGGANIANGVSGGNTVATVADLGLTRKAIHEAPQVRNAESANSFRIGSVSARSESRSPGIGKYPMPVPSQWPAGPAGHESGGFKDRQGARVCPGAESQRVLGAGAQRIEPAGSDGCRDRRHGVWMGR